MSLPDLPPNAPSSRVFSVPHADSLEATKKQADAHDRVASLLEAASPTQPKQDHEVWLEAVLVRSTGTRLADTNAKYADQIVQLYRARFRAPGQVKP